MPIVLLERQRKFVLTASDGPRVEKAQEAGESLARRLRGHPPQRDLPRVSCTARTLPTRARSGTPTPMMRMLGSGGRGGDVRLKLYLSMLWASPGGDHDTDFDAASWAQLLGLHRWSTNGKRRIYEAAEWLRSRVRREDRPSRSPLD